MQIRNNIFTNEQAMHKLQLLQLISALDGIKIENMKNLLLVEAPNHDTTAKSIKMVNNALG